VIARNLTEIIIIPLMNIKLRDSRRLSEKEKKNRMQRSGKIVRFLKNFTLCLNLTIASNFQT
jgi:hypothetical protein